ncbi:hypothetical protein D3C77_722270 [compost metagenome]
MLLVLEPLAAPLLHTGNELLVGGFQHTLPEGRFVRFLRLEWIKEGLVLTRRIGTTLDTQLLHGADKAVASCRHTNRAHQAGLVGIDLVSRTGDIVGT